MIRRTLESDWLLITQSEHARMCGFLAEHWGNGGFIRSSSWDDIVLAAREHDNAWDSADFPPDLNDKGEPLDFLEVPFRDTFDVFRLCIRNVHNQGGPYAASLVNRHFLNTARNVRTHQRLTPEVEPIVEAYITESREREARLCGEAENQAAYRRAVTPEGLKRNGRFVSTLDNLSLIACCGWSHVRSVRDVPAAEGYMELAVQRVNDFSLLISPWPFDTELLEWAVRGHRIPSDPFLKAADFRAFLDQIPASETIVRFSPG